MNSFEQQIRRADVLVEALPYLQKFRGQTFVIKYGGSAMEDPLLVASVLRDIVYLEVVGINPVVVHGGGKAITRRMKERGLEAKFIAGLRVTDKASVDIVAEVLDTNINPGIVQKLNEFGGSARSFSGATVFRAEKSPAFAYQGGTVDLGYVGDVTGCQIPRVLECVHQETVPVISPIGRDEQRQVYNINADIAAAEIAIALEAEKIIYLSDVNGVLRDPKDASTRIPTISDADVQSLKAESIIDGGMLPKVNSCLKALHFGVKKVHLIDGRIPHALLLELFTDKGIGTEIVLENNN
ncbi:MAG: acetylglutamate kinase [Verrucomicrobiales bacterium]|jgi:acetylglutamate kinase|nr:acetylglutamate kinase [Verrucomicrobiales bacterium]